MILNLVLYLYIYTYTIHINWCKSCAINSFGTGGFTIPDVSRRQLFSITTRQPEIMLLRVVPGQELLRMSPILQEMGALLYINESP